MNCPRHQLLADPTLALDQHREGRPGGAKHHLPHQLHGLAVANQLRHQRRDPWGAGALRDFVGSRRTGTGGESKDQGNVRCDDRRAHSPMAPQRTDDGGAVANWPRGLDRRSAVDGSNRQPGVECAQGQVKLADRWRRRSGVNDDVRLVAVTGDEGNR